MIRKGKEVVQTCQQSFPAARRPIEEQAFGRSVDLDEELGIV
jgi:hypothetical protein